MAVEIAREDLTAAQLRAAAGRAKNGRAARRMLAIALVLEGTDRKAAASLSRAANKVVRAKQRAALLSGDESALPTRDKGPVRRYIRDVVDSRYNVGEFMLPVMVVVLALTFIPTFVPSIASWTTLIVVSLVYGLIVVGIFDAVLMWRRMKAKIVTRFGEAPPRGSAMYAVTRAFQMRRSRLPRPQVARGFKTD